MISYTLSLALSIQIMLTLIAFMLKIFCTLYILYTHIIGKNWTVATSASAQVYIETTDSR